MAFTFSKLASAVWRELGKIASLETFLATGGSVTTIVNGKWADREEGPDDNYCVDYTAIVLRDAGGANAAPEGEMQRISSYDSATYTYTVDTAFTVAPASGDRIALANSEIPLQEMYEAANRGLLDLGYLPAVDVSLTTAAGQTEYTLPVALKPKDLLSVEYQGNTGDSDDNRWTPVSDWELYPSAPGATSVLVLPQLPSGRTIKIVYWGLHPDLTAHSSVVSEYVHPRLAILATTIQALRWMMNASQGGTDFDKQRYNEALQEYAEAKIRHPIKRFRNLGKWMVVGSSSDDRGVPSPIL